jgi:hypothetical protein
LTSEKVCINRYFRPIYTMKKSENSILKIENIVASGSVAEAIDLEDHTMLRVKTFISNPIVHCESHFKRHIHKIP